MKIIIDNKIPFIKGRLEKASDNRSGKMPPVETIYASPSEMTRQLVKDADALIIRTRTHCDAKLLEGTKVRLIVTATIGTDHIDIPWCENNGICVRNAAGSNAPGVAQYVWSSLLRCGFSISAQTLGVVGYGHVGSIVADWGRQMGVNVLVCDPPRQKAGFTDNDYVSLDHILGSADAVTLHTPLTHDGKDATFHMIGERELSIMRRGAILINTSRGPVVDNTAWTRHLEEGNTRAVVDVWENEPDINLNLLEKAVIATPHIAGYSFEGKQRATRMALAATGRFFGIDIPLDGLCPDYVSPGAMLTAGSCGVITDSYNPCRDDAILRANPAEFEKLRGDYDYRHEPFIKR